MPTPSVSFYNPHVWRLVSHAGAPGAPPERDQASAVWDPKGVRLLVFGGISASGIVLNDLWQLTWSGVAWVWSEIVGTTVPPARQAHTAVWDTAKNRMLVFGGFGSEGNVHNDVWWFEDADHWQRVSTVGTRPPARAAHTAVWSPSKAAMIVFGGLRPFDVTTGMLTLFKDVWILRGERWIKVPTNNGPTARSGASSVWDTKSRAMFMYGGMTSMDPFVLDDLWVLRLKRDGSAEWTFVGSTREHRSGHSAVWDIAANRMLVLGGQTSSFSLASELWQFSGQMWTSLGPAPGSPQPPASMLRAAAYSDRPSRVFVFGGFTTAGRTNELWVYEKRFPLTFLP